MSRLRFWIWRFFKVRKGWSPGVAPECCPDQMTYAAAYDTGGGWWLHWYCDVCGAPDEPSCEIPWPMKKDWATSKDLSQLGFKIV